MTHPNFYREYKGAVAMSQVKSGRIKSDYRRPPLAFPLSGEENQPIRDAHGRVVSTHEYGDVFQRIGNERAAFMVLMERIVELLQAVTGPNATVHHTRELAMVGDLMANMVRLARGDQHVEYPWLSELLPPLTVLYRAFLAERDAAYDAGTDDAGQYLTTDDKLAVKKMDEQLDDAAAALRAAGVKI